jgi:hypothetical protein
MKFKVLGAILLCFITSSCATVPKESVELSTTIGRDLAVVHESHRETAKIIFSRMRNDINRFIEDVYAPYQISRVMSRQKDLATSSDPSDRRKSLLLAINAAFSDDASPKLQNAVLKGMGSMVFKLRKDIELMRTQLLDSVNLQEKDLLASIDRAYQQLHYANSIVTGHLSSVVKVHNTQAELLESIGVEKDLRSYVGEHLSEASDKISKLVDKAEKADNKLDKAEENAIKIKQELEKLKAKFSDD